jgi:AraC-like DNA-binding protein
VAVDVRELASLRCARDMIDWHYQRPLDVPTMARAAAMSPAHFARRYRQTFGETPYQHLVSRRVERAKALLRNGTTPVAEVCLAVGFASLGAFNARFRELTGLTPTEYRATAIEPYGVPPCLARHLARDPSGRSSRNQEADRPPPR